MSNPNRKPADQSIHDRMVLIVANNLQANGYTVLADHISWSNGAPSTINGHIPDIIASKPGTVFILEVEDCTTYADNHTRSQLTAFIGQAATYVVIPDTCVSNARNYDPVGDMSTVLSSWGLSSVKVATVNLSTGSIAYY